MIRNLGYVGQDLIYFSKFNPIQFIFQGRLQASGYYCAVHAYFRYTVQKTKT